MYEFTKRIMDITLSIILLIFFLPIIAVTAVIIKISSPGSIFADTPKRAGKDGKLFYPFKFRSMIVNAYQLLRTDPKYKKAFKEQQKSGFYKIKEDPRVTPIGKVIRKHSIDEIPQLINVLRGEMSIVGPRPYYPEEFEQQMNLYPKTKPYVEEVLKIKPGITGLWQVSGRSELRFDKRIALDAYYAKRKSILLDIIILLRTPYVMLTGKGAV